MQKLIELADAYISGVLSLSEFQNEMVIHIATPDNLTKEEWLQVATMFSDREFG